MEKLRYKLPTLTVSTLFFGFLAYVGWQMTKGSSLGGSRGIVHYVTDALNFLSDAVGAQAAGYGVMAAAIAGAVAAAVFIWRDPMM